MTGFAHGQGFVPDQIGPTTKKSVTPDPTIDAAQHRVAALELFVRGAVILSPMNLRFR
jgi:hypothetical protein